MNTTGRKTVKGEKTSAPKAVKAKSKGTDSTTATPVASTVSNSASSTPTFEQIAKRSYELYLQRGSVDGFHEQDWLQAESELLSGR